jgi:undecaprenyl phosphate-alpha-L-ara4N flippase subunit ArnE
VISPGVLGIILCGSLLAAVGQVALKLGAHGRVSPGDFLNGWLAIGLGCYAAGTILWIYALSRAPLTVVFPFTALTFVLVYAAGVIVLGEPTSARQIAGMALVLAGLYLVAAR